MFPIGTDAPVYHWPYGTVGLIAVNSAIAVLFMLVGYEQAEPLVLQYGTINPIQWFTSPFIHLGIAQLLGNMFGLWGLGLVVEGKIGWQRFIAIYVILGASDAAAEQLATLGATEGFSFGASAVVLGLVAMAMIWAPKNELTFVFFLGFFPLQFDLSILFFAILQIGIQVLLALLFFSPLVLAVNLAAAIVGAGIAVAMLKRGMVDCENWDIFALWHDRLGQSEQQHCEERETPAERAARALEHRRSLWARVHDLVERGQPLEAYQLYENLRPTLSEGDLDRKDLDALVRGLHKAELWPSLVPLLVEYLKRFPAGTERMRLLLAQILLREEKRPSQALAVLSKLKGTPLPPKLEQARRQLTAAAKKMQADGAIEFQIQDW